MPRPANTLSQLRIVYKSVLHSVTSPYTVARTDHSCGPCYVCLGDRASLARAQCQQCLTVLPCCHGSSQQLQTVLDTLSDAHSTKSMLPLYTMWPHCSLRLLRVHDSAQWHTPRRIPCCFTKRCSRVCDPSAVRLHRLNLARL
jgi:hypothetical protein